MSIAASLVSGALAHVDSSGGAQQQPQTPRKPSASSSGAWKDSAHYKTTSQLVTDLQTIDPKIKRATLRGVYKKDLLKNIREATQVARLPTRRAPSAEGAEKPKPFHKMNRYDLIKLAVTDGIGGKKYNHEDLWNIRKTTKRTRASLKKEGAAEAVVATSS